jgi:hydrogenase maturation protease
VAIAEATELLNVLRHCEHLIVIDACRSGRQSGTVTRLPWPDRRIAVRHRRSTHGVGLVEVLKLAERLGELPPNVEIWGIEVGDCAPAGEIGRKTLRAVAKLEAQLYSDLMQAAESIGQA